MVWTGVGFLKVSDAAAGFPLGSPPRHWESLAYFDEICGLENRQARK